VLNDLNLFQQAWNTPPPNQPKYTCDLTLDNVCGLQDFVVFNQHYNAPGHNVPPGRQFPEGEQTDGGEIARLGEEQTNNSLTTLYLHIADRDREGAPPPVVLPDQAVSEVRDVGPNGRDMTVWLYAMGYAELEGVHVLFSWPDGWVLDRVNDALLERQIFGHRDGYVPRQRGYLTAFECVTGGAPLAVGQFDVHVNSAGAVLFDREDGLMQVADCRGGLTDLGVQVEGGRVAGAPVSTSKTGVNGGPPTLARLSPTASHGAEFMLSLEGEFVVSAQIYDVAGRLVKTLHEERIVLPGRHSLSWDGTTSLGVRAASGVYLLKLQAGETRFVERMILIR
jgi:hypothetical protein